MNPGKLSKTATFQKCIRVPDGAGGFIETWENDFTLKANLRGLNPQHKDFLSQSATVIPSWLIIRKHPTHVPKPRMKILLDGKPYNVLSIREYTPDKKYWEIEAVELAP